MKTLSLIVLLTTMASASAEQFFNGSKAEHLLVGLMDAGAYVDCRQGLCTVHATDVNCSESACQLNVKMESGAYMVTRLGADAATDLREALSAIDAKEKLKSVSCLFPRWPDEPSSQTQCLVGEE